MEKTKRLVNKKKQGEKSYRQRVRSNSGSKKNTARKINLKNKLPTEVKGNRDSKHKKPNNN